MKIIMVARRYWPAVGGVESYLRHLARELAREHEVTVVARRIDDGETTRLTDSLSECPPFERFHDGRVEVVPLRIPAARRLALAPLLLYTVPGLRRYAWGRARIPTARLYARIVAPLIAAHARDTDVVHAWGGDLLATAAVRAAEICDAVSAITPAAHPDQYGTGPVDARAYRAAGRVIAQLAADAETYRALGVPDERIAICGAASDGLPSSRERGETLRGRHGIQGALVLFVGRRVRHKGYELLLEAAAHLPNVTFAFAGPGPALTPRGGRVLDLGRVDDEERAAWMTTADVLCLPSSAESFGVVLLEAWSVGTPVLTSDIAPLSELIESTGGGFTAPLDSAAIATRLRELLATPAVLREAGAAGAASWRDRYTSAAVAARHLETYEQLLKAKKLPQVGERSAGARLLAEKP